MSSLNKSNPTNHNKKFCKNEQKCAKCRQTGHEDQDCENEIECANCDGDHPAYIRNCPKWKTEKEILKRKFHNNISFHEARQQVEGPATDPSKNSYANITKPHQWTNSIKNPNIFKSEEEWLTHTIDSLLKRLDEIKNQKSNQNKAPCTSSASQSNEITLAVSNQITPEQKMNRQFRILGLLYHRLLNLMHLQLLTMKMKWKALMQDQNEVIMTALTRNQIVLSAKSLPLVPQSVGGMALTCRQGQEEEIYQRSPLSALTLQDQEDRGLLGENGLPYGLLTIKNTKHKQSLRTKVSQELLKIHTYKSWLTTTLSSGIVEVLEVIE